MKTRSNDVIEKSMFDDEVASSLLSKVYTSIGNDDTRLNFIDHTIDLSGLNGYQIDLTACVFASENWTILNTPMFCTIQIFIDDGPNYLFLNNDRAMYGVSLEDGSIQSIGGGAVILGQTNITIFGNVYITSLAY